MTFESFARLTGASLRNHPSVSSFERVVTEARGVRYKDLYIGDDPDEIAKALQNGAYAIVSTRDLPIEDPEIAWFRVEDLNETLIKLLRYSLLQKSLRLYYADPVLFAYLQRLCTQKEILFLTSDLAADYKKIDEAAPKSVLIGQERRLIERLSGNFETIPPHPQHDLKLLHHTLFRSTFLYRGRLYRQIKVPPLFLDTFMSALHFCERHGDSVEIEKLSFIEHFHPLFVSQNIHLRSYGSSDHVIVCEEHPDLIERACRYLRQEAPWAKIVLLLRRCPPSPKAPCDLPCYTLTDTDSVTLLSRVEFNFAIVGEKSAIIRQILERQAEKERNRPLLKESYD